MSAAAYTVVGAGAIGGTLAHALTKAGHRVTVVDTDAEHVAAIARNGLSLRRDAVGETTGPLDTVQVAGAFTPGTAPRDVLGRVLLATKAQHTDDAALWIADRLSPDGIVVSVQNGRNEPVIAARVGADRTLGAFVNIFADWAEPGVIRDGGHGALVVGLPDGGAPDARVLDIAEDLRAYPGAVATANLPGYRWAKRAFGSILGFTSVADRPLAESVDQFRDVAWAIAAEQTAQALAAGVVLEAFDAFEPYAFTAGAPERVRTAALDRLIAWLWTQPKDRSGGFRDLAVRKRPLERSVLAPESDASVPLLGAAVGRQLTEIQAGTRRFSTDNFHELRALLRVRPETIAAPAIDQIPVRTP